ncbi:nucleolar protein 11-like [Asterias amurensis]|uniref:nucleolar protein 11-like n=1 Tax=Asterias amurensis TaxID=7602 RepID=UPI003AB3807F
MVDFSNAETPSAAVPTMVADSKSDSTSSVLHNSVNLASRLGQNGSSSQSTQPSIPVTVSWAKKSKTKADKSLSVQDEVEQLIEDILNPSKVKTTTKFNQLCETLLDKTCKSSTLTLSWRTTSAGVILNNVVDRHSDKKPFWPKKSLLNLIRDCNIAASSCTPLILLAIELKDLEVVDCCINHMQDIPDSILTKSLQFYIRYFQSEGVRGQQTGDDELATAAPQFSIMCSCPQYVNKVLSCPFNDTFILDYLKQFSFDEALVLLQYLFCLVKGSSSQQNDSTPTLNAVADWTSALLDAHFSQFLLSYEARELLFKLADAVKYQEMFYNELEAVQAILESFKTSASVPVKQTSGSYSIEVLIM